MTYFIKKIIYIKTDDKDDKYENLYFSCHHNIYECVNDYIIYNSLTKKMIVNEYQLYHKNIEYIQVHNIIINDNIIISDGKIVDLYIKLNDIYIFLPDSIYRDNKYFVYKLALRQAYN